ncbi:MAG: hypothetical protein ABIH42_08520, partial [Planctomycetota bacterium]
HTHGNGVAQGIGTLAYSKRGSDYQIPHKDQLGSTQELSDANETVTQYYEYDSFGNKVEDAGSAAKRL